MRVKAIFSAFVVVIVIAVGMNVSYYSFKSKFGFTPVKDVPKESMCGKTIQLQPIPASNPDENNQMFFVDASPTPKFKGWNCFLCPGENRTIVWDWKIIYGHILLGNKHPKN